MIRSTLLVALATLTLAGAAPLRAPAQTPEYRGASALGLALRRMGPTQRVLMIGAHPDDEDTQLLAALALQGGVDVAYLSLTRGEGGQNGIGPELGEALGLLRSEELLSARRVDGARQLFTRAFEFGYSKTPEEAARHWPREALLEDVVGAIRRFRPDVVVSVFSGTPRDGHGQHQLAGLLTREAFEISGDSTRFPHQLAQGLSPHRASKLYRTLRSDARGATVRLSVGERDPLLGRSPFQLAMASRSRHRSQDMGRAEPSGPRWSYLRRWTGGAPAPETSLFADLDTLLSQRARGAGGSLRRELEAYEADVREIRSRVSLLDPSASVQGLAGAADRLERAAKDPSLSGELRRHLIDELSDARRALAQAAGLVLDPVSSELRFVPGDTLTLEVTLWNGGTRPVQVRELLPDLPAGWRAVRSDSGASVTAPPGEALRRTFRIEVPRDAPVDGPYYLRAPRDGALYAWPDRPELHGAPFDPAELTARALVVIAGAEVELREEATFREVDLRQGEIRRVPRLVPAVSVLVDPPARVFPVGGSDSLRIQVTLAAYGASPISGTLRLDAPDGWRVEPAELPLQFTGGDQQRVLDVRVTPSAGAAGERVVSAEFVTHDGRRFDRGVQWIEYPHVAPRALHRRARARIQGVDVTLPAGLRVGYVVGAGEEGPPILEQLGIRPRLLDAEALGSAVLSELQVIVVGSRAYEVRPDLAAANGRLLEWVRDGGTLIVQYNKYELPEGGFTPYPFRIARPHDRVTDEAAPVKLLEPDHRLLSWPNRITAADFEGWIQDRALYVPREWDPRYTALLEMADPGDSPLRGALLIAPYGRGTYVYTGLAFFRQLPEGVPGAWRLFANLLALGSDPRT